MNAPCSPGVLVALTDHALERFSQRVPRRHGEIDARVELCSRVSEAWAAGRFVKDTTPADAPQHLQRGEIFVNDLYDRELVFVCRRERDSEELVVITLWEQERLRPARVPKRFTDALRERG